MNLLNLTEIIKAADGATSAGTDVNGITIDTSDCEGVILFARIATANAGNFLKAQEGDTTSPTADIAGSKVIATENGQVVALDIHKPLKRYLRGVIVRAGTNTVTGDLFAVKYGAKKLPDSGASVNKIIASPAAGTP